MEKRVNNAKKYAPLIGVLILFATYALCAALIVLSMTGGRYDLRLGMEAPETLYATRSVTDSVATEVLRDAARARTPVVYRIDSSRAQELQKEAENFFASLGSLRSYALSAQTANLNAAGWEARLSAEQKARYCAMTVPQLSEEQLFAALAAGEGELALLENLVLPKLSTSLGAGLAPESVEAVRAACEAEIQAATGLNTALKGLASSLLAHCMQPTCVEDTEATELARSEAAAAVEEIRVKKGEPIVLEGERIGEGQLAILTELDLVRPENADNAPVIGALLALFAAFFLFLVYLAERAGALLCEHKRLALLSLLLLLTVGLFFLTGRLNAHISLSMYAILLCATLIAPHMGMVAGLLLGFIQALMCGGEGGVYAQFDSLAVFAGVAFAGCAAVFAQRRSENRASYISAGAIGGAAGALVIFALCMMHGRGWVDSLVDMGFFLLSALLSALLVVGSMTIWEKLFDAATPARLHELLNTSHPLLKQMMAEAPGTYQHSMNVAALCEAAAGRIGADALLARVGASYHDVGKLRRPLYFAENQKKGVNIHDTLPPQESASIITAHQRDGVALLNKYKFPSAVTRLVGEHHGNSLVAYFYYKALQEDPQALQKDFRYNGSKPSTAESAILMLADSCEAGVRSLGDCTREARAEMIHKIIQGKLNDAENNLMDESPLTLRQLGEIERSFNKTFNGIMHDRIEYPEDLEATKA